MSSASPPPPSRQKRRPSRIFTPIRANYVVHLDTDPHFQRRVSRGLTSPAEGGLPLSDCPRSADPKRLAARFSLGLTITQYNPDKDPDGSNAQKKLIDLLVESLSVRTEGRNTHTDTAAGIGRRKL